MAAVARKTSATTPASARAEAVAKAVIWMLSLGTLLVTLTATIQTASGAAVDDDFEKAHEAKLRQLRGTIANQVHLAAMGLADEMVYEWTRTPVFPVPTPVVLASVTVPVGTGSGLQALIENHINALLIENPETHIQPSHCPACNAVTVHSGPEATVVSRGIDDPETLVKIKQKGTQYGLFVDFEAEGRFLVMRARITRLDENLQIVWAKTLSTSGSTPSLLRNSTRLVSAAEARLEYLNVLAQRGRWSVPFKLSVRGFGAASTGVAPPPLLWAQTGIEVALNDAATWTSSFLLGYTYIPQSYTGLMVQARMSRLISGQARSLTSPNVYLFLGTAVMRVEGPGVVSYRDDILSVEDVLGDQPGNQPVETLPGIHFGFDVRLGNRVGFAIFAETLTTQWDSPNLGEILNILGIGFQTVGLETSFSF